MKMLPYIVLLSLLAMACAKDNYTAPSITFKGNVTYNGEPINVEYNQVNFQLWEPGWGKLASIDVPIAQDGSFASLLFAGKYKLVFPKGQGPFMTKVQNASAKDTLYIDLTGNQALNIEVTPYYLIKNANFTSETSAVSTTFDISKIITDANAKDIERVSLYINKTQFVAGSSNINVTHLTGANITSLTGVKLSVNIPTITPAQNYVYARVGLKVSGVEDMVFSQVQKIQFK